MLYVSSVRAPTVVHKEGGHKRWGQRRPLWLVQRAGSTAIGVVISSYLIMHQTLVPVRLGGGRKHTNTHRTQTRHKGSLRLPTSVTCVDPHRSALVWKFGNVDAPTYVCFRSVVCSLEQRACLTDLNKHLRTTAQRPSTSQPAIAFGICSLWPVFPNT